MGLFSKKKVKGPSEDTLIMRLSFALKAAKCTIDQLQGIINELKKEIKQLKNKLHKEGVGRSGWYDKCVTLMERVKNLEEQVQALQEKHDFYKKAYLKHTKIVTIDSTEENL